MGRVIDAGGLYFLIAGGAVSAARQHDLHRWSIVTARGQFGGAGRHVELRKSRRT
jgi:hypothetical protein